MLLQILIFELRYRFKRPATYAYFIILFAMAFLAIYSNHVQVGASSGLVNKNSPHTINTLVVVLMVFGTMISSAVMGVPVFRDFEYGFHEIMFTTPIKKWQYLGGRFLGSYFTGLFIFSGILFGNMAGSVFPGVDTEHIGPFMLQAYINPFLLYVAPNLLMLGLLFFAMGSLFRSQLAIYVQGVVLFALYLVIISNQRDIDNNRIFSILDPFGLSATGNITRYWTVTEKNTMLVPLSGLLLYNRLLWTGIALVIGLVFYRLFRFSKSAPSLKKKRKEEEAGPTVIQPLTIPAITCHYSPASRLKQWWFLVWFDFRGVVRAVPFIAIALCGVLILLSNSTGIGEAYGTNSLPVTYMILDLLKDNFILFIIIIITFYSGELLWKEIDARLAPIIDATSLSSPVMLTAKFTAMILAEIVLLALLILTGIFIQTINGFYDFQLPVYIKTLSLITFPYLFLITMLTFLVHSVVNNKFLGHVIVIVFWISNIFLVTAFDIDHNLAWYANAPTTSYSAMNGLGHFAYPILMFDAYWLMPGIVFMMLALLMMKRGSEIEFRSRLLKARSAWKAGTGRVVIPLCLVLFLLFGGFIYYNTNVLNTYRSPKAERKLAVDYETTYSRYKNMNQPRITSVYAEVDLYPEKRKVDCRGSYIIRNKSDRPIDTLILVLPEDAGIRQLELQRPFKQVIGDRAQGFYMYRLQEQLLPGDSTRLDFKLSYETKGFPNDGGNTNIVYNGTFINNSLFPQFGYDEGKELQDDDRRKEAGLSKKPFRMNPIRDSSQYKNTYLTSDADWIRYEAVVSTSPDQIAISPGYLQKEWNQNGRRYFHYKMDVPIWNFFSFLSARYQVLRDHYQGVNIEIYYHPGHTYDLPNMVNGIKKTLAYAGKSFSPYQHKQVRIIEFPRYQLFAQSFPNTIPYSEGIGFIMDVDKKTDIDMAFYVTAHEVGHQWWGHQVCGANVQGATMMVESMAQYTALMVMEHEYGKSHMEKFLKYELDRYLRGRSGERKRELPLMLNENQQYIHYQKGSLVFYALKDYIGEDSLNAALSRFVKDYAFKDGPYPTSVDFLSYIYKVTPDSMRYVVADLFEHITLFSNKTNALSALKQPNGTWKVNLETECHKYRADSIGNEQEITMKDWMDVGVYTTGSDGKDSLIWLEKRRMTKGINRFEITVSPEPTRAGIDPLHILIDRNSGDNTKTLSD